MFLACRPPLVKGFALLVHDADGRAVFVDQLNLCPFFEHRAQRVIKLTSLAKECEKSREQDRNVL